MSILGAESSDGNVSEHVEDTANERGNVGSVQNPLVRRDYERETYDTEARGVDQAIERNKGVSECSNALIARLGIAANLHLL